MNIKNKIILITLLGLVSNTYCKSYFYKACKFYVLTMVTGGIYPVYKTYEYFKSKSDNEVILEAEKINQDLNNYYKSSKFINDIKEDKNKILEIIKLDLEKIRSYVSELNKRASKKNIDFFTLKRLNDTSTKLVTLMQNIEFLKDVDIK